MTRLGITVPFHDDETVASFGSRTAAANGIRTAREFSAHMGFLFQQIVDGDQNAINEFAYLTDRDPEELQSRALIKDAAMFRLRGERLSKFQLARTTARFCPHCLREDKLRGTGPEHSRGYGRIDWIFTCVRTCQKHGVFLTEATAPSRSTVMNDFVAMVREASDVVTIPDEAPTSGYERYIRDRLVGLERTEEWLDSMPLQVSLRVPEVIGGMVHHGRKFRFGDLNTRQLLEAAETGFGIMAKGKNAFIEFLVKHHDLVLERDGDIGGRRIYGSLYELLAHDNSDPDFDEIRAIMKNTAIDAFPIGPGNEFFGPIERRRWHSLQSAAKVSHVHYLTLKKILRSLDLISDADMKLSAHRIIVDAEVMDRLLSKVASGLQFKDARDFVNAPRVQWDRLVDTGYVKPFIERDLAVGVMATFARSDLDNFLASLLDKATEEFREDEDMLDIVNIRRRALCKIDEIMDLLLGGKLARVAIDPAERGFMALRLSLTEVTSKVRLDEHGGLSLREAEKSLRMSGAVLLKLIDRGDIQAEQGTNPTNRCPQTIVKRIELDAFEKRFISLYWLAREAELHIHQMRRVLDDAGIKAAITSDEVGATFYTRGDVGQWLKKGTAN
ncbi:TniQ family protein [Rhizobium sp. 1399]|uniref:TniQ family protein n=1 Tax=Rhizobium sp. 1399 TaxID=2817758 RepID=UPI00285C4EF3|nr:TniQ family protein [Rhizobium sp. 1399]MDR6667069.1 hypothetical protein [Rhizobium sp. 1399]